MLTWPADQHSHHASEGEVHGNHILEAGRAATLSDSATVGVKKCPAQVQASSCRQAQAGAGGPHTFAMLHVREG